MSYRIGNMSFWTICVFQTIVEAFQASVLVWTVTILISYPTDLHRWHFLQQSRPQVIMTSEQLRELYTTLLKFHIQMRPERIDNCLNFAEMSDLIKQNS